MQYYLLKLVLYNTYSCHYIMSMAKNKKGKPSDDQRKKPRFPGQYASTGTKQSGYKTLTIRIDDGTLALANDLGKLYHLTRTDVFKLGIRLAQRHADTMLENPDDATSALITRVVPDLKKFDVLVRRQSKGGRSELAALWRDFDAVQRIENDDMREQALEMLEQKLKLIFSRARLKERKPEPAMTTDLELA